MLGFASCQAIARDGDRGYGCVERLRVLQGEHTLIEGLSIGTLVSLVKIKNNVLHDNIPWHTSTMYSSKMYCKATCNGVSIPIEIYNLALVYGGCRQPAVDGLEEEMKQM